MKRKVLLADVLPPCDTYRTCILILGAEEDNEELTNYPSALTFFPINNDYVYLYNPALSDADIMHVGLSAKKKISINIYYIYVASCETLMRIVTDMSGHVTVEKI